MAIRNLAILLLLLFTACDGLVTDTPGESASVSLQVTFAEGVTLSAVDEARAYIRGPRSFGPITLQPGVPYDVPNLPPGNNYRVSLEGLVGGEVVVFGETDNLRVTAGQTTTVPIQLQSFDPVLQTLPPTVDVGGSLNVQFSGVFGGLIYTVEVADNPEFSNPIPAVSTENFSLPIPMITTGSWYLRVRAWSEFGSKGKPSGTAAVTVGKPVPTLTSLSQDHITIGSEGFTLTVQGRGFTGESSILWNETELPTTLLSATELSAVVPAENISSPGRVPVAVFNPGPSGGTSAEVIEFSVRIPVTGPLLGGGNWFTCGLAASGGAYCWGDNSRGQLGTGGSLETYETAPAAVWGGHRFVTVSAGRHHACALDEVGQAFCWGSSDYGQPGNGSFGAQEGQPVAVLGEHNFLKISAGSFHTCGLTQDGKAYCWGRNHYGQLGAGQQTPPELTPVPVWQGSAVYKAISGGGSFTCGLTDEGTVHCWGLNSYGRLGDGTTVNRAIPTAVVGLADVEGVTTGSDHACAWTVSGAGYCWGRGSVGRLGLGDSQNQRTPQLLNSATGFTQMSAGGKHTCGILDGGAVLCWGGNWSGALGTGDLKDHDTPAVALNLPPIAEIMADDKHTCALTETGEAFCWGTEGWGALGNGAAGYRTPPSTVGGSPGSFVKVVTGNHHSCGVGPTGTTYCWGGNPYGQLGDGTTNPSHTPMQLSTSQRFTTDLTAGVYHSCGLNDLGEAFCWGLNEEGELGIGSFGASEVNPTPVTGGHFFKTLSGGAWHTCGVTTDDQVLCWGYGADRGQLGNGIYANQPAPTPISIGGEVTFKTVEAGYSHTCGLATTGEVWCWGNNAEGQLGDGNRGGSQPSPVSVAGLPANIVHISAGDRSTCALDDTHQAFCWGSGAGGRLGNGGETDFSTPQQVEGGHAFRSIEIVRAGVFAITEDGQGFAWGGGTNGKLGTGRAFNENIPTPMTGGLSWASISDGFGSHHHCGVTNSGVAHCWGNQSLGQLGNEQWGAALTPVQVQGGVNFSRPPQGVGRR